MTILAIDLGTSAIKFLRADSDLHIRSVDRIPVLGLDVDTWLDALHRNIRDHGDGGQIDAISITGQMHGLMTWEDGGFGPGIPWTDQRGASIASTLNDDLGSGTVARLGGPRASGFLDVSLAWIRTNDPARWQRIRQVMLPKDALARALTGRHVTDPTDAAGSGLLDVATGTWDADILHHIGIPPEWLPEIVSSGTGIDRILPAAAKKLGLSRETRIVIAGGDAPVGAYGAGISDEGDALLLLSSGAQVILPSTTFAPDPAGRWYTWPSVAGGFLRVGTLLNAGTVIDWSRQLMEGLSTTPERPTSLIVLPHLIGERTPQRDADLRGAMLGLTADTTAGDIHRAMVEGVAYAIRHALEVMWQDGKPAGTIRIGGGGTNVPGFQQIITDVLGIPTRRLATSELTALGAAALASGSTPHPSLEPAVAPLPDSSARYQDRYAIYRDALDATQPISHRLAALERDERS